MYRGPYALLMSLPGFNSLRVPARFWMLSVLCLSVVGAVLFDRLGARFPTARRVLAAVVVLAAIAEGWMVTFPVAPVPDVWKPHACAPPRGSDGAVLELPMGAVVEDVGAMYRSISHRRPTVNGYSGYFPSHYAPLQIGLRLRDPDVLTRLAGHGARYVMIDRGSEFERALRQYVGGHEGVELVCSNETHFIFRLPPQRALEHHVGAPLAIAALSANVNGNLSALMTDGDLTTRWMAGPQDPGMMVEIDLGVPRRIGAIETSLGSHDKDFPRGLKIEASNDGREWREIWRGTSAGLAFTGALRRPAAIPLVFGVSVEARFLRMWLTEKDDTFFWSIAEMKVLGP
jgi:hypothetical protein